MEGVEACSGCLHKKVLKKYLYIVLPSITKFYLHPEGHIQYSRTLLLKLTEHKNPPANA